LLAITTHALCARESPERILLCNGSQGIPGPIGVRGPPGETYLPTDNQESSWVWDWTVWFIKLPFQILFESLTRAIALTLNYVLNLLVVAAVGAAVSKYFGKAAPVLASAPSWATAGSGFQLGGV